MLFAANVKYFQKYYTFQLPNGYEIISFSQAIITIQRNLVMNEYNIKSDIFLTLKNVTTLHAGKLLKPILTKILARPPAEHVHKMDIF